MVVSAKVGRETPILSGVGKEEAVWKSSSKLWFDAAV
jgi:hypothetical protein